MLFLAGTDYGGTNMLDSWALQMTGPPFVPPSITWIPEFGSLRSHGVRF